MGNTPGREGAGAGGAAAGAEPAAPIYPARLVHSEEAVLPSLPSSVGIRPNVEALEVVDQSNPENKVVHRWAYFTILCWGHTDYTFQFRTFAKDPEAEGSSETHLMVVTLVGRKGRELEDHVMAAVRRLMSKMDAQGVPKSTIAAIREAVQQDPDKGLEVITSASIGRRFTTHQATQVLGMLSSFDKVEAAVTMYPSLMDPSSFALVLQQFEDEEDQDNVCARLGLELAAVRAGAGKGSVATAPKR